MKNRLEETLAKVEASADDSSIKKLRAIGAKLVPIVRELDKLETEGDFHFSSFVAGAGIKLNNVTDLINNYKG